MVINEVRGLPQGGPSYFLAPDERNKQRVIFSHFPCAFSADMRHICILQKMGRRGGSQTS